MKTRLLPYSKTILAVTLLVSTLFPPKSFGQVLNTGAFQGLPETSVTSLGAAELDLIRILGYSGPNVNWWLDAVTPGHSFAFDMNSPTGFLTSHFYTTISLWSWSSANPDSPVAMRLTQAGRLTLGGTWESPDAPIILDPNAVGGPTVNVAGGITGQTLQISGAAIFTGTVSLGGTTISSFGSSLLASDSAASARAILDAASTEVPPFWKYAIEMQNTNYGAMGSPASTGSGVTYWPSRNTFLLLDNTVGAGRVLEFDRTGSLLRSISLAGFGDAEDIHWISGDTFVISQERNSGSLDEIDVIDLPTTGTSVNISSAARRLRINTSVFTSLSNLGLEGVALIGNDFYFATEKAPSKPSAEWNVWKVPNIGSGTMTVTPSRVFRLTGLLYGRATDVSGLATDGTYLWILSHEGPVSNGFGRVLKTTLDGRLIEENTLPCFSDGSVWLQAEGIELFTDTDGKMKFAIAGEVGSGGRGVDFMVLSTP